MSTPGNLLVVCVEQVRSLDEHRRDADGAADAGVDEPIVDAVPTLLVLDALPETELRWQRGARRERQRLPSVIQHVFGKGRRRVGGRADPRVLGGDRARARESAARGQLDPARLHVPDVGRLPAVENRCAHEVDRVARLPIEERGAERPPAAADPVGTQFRGPRALGHERRRAETARIRVEALGERRHAERAAGRRVELHAAAQPRHGGERRARRPIRTWNSRPPVCPDR